MRAHLEAVSILSGKKVQIDFETAGLTDRLIIGRVLKKIGVKIDLDKVLRMGEEIYKKKYFKMDIRAKIEGVEKFLNYLTRKKHELYLLTGNLESIAEMRLKRVNLWKYFSGGVFGDVFHSSRQDPWEIVFGKIW